MLFALLHRQLRSSEMWSVLFLFVLPTMLFSVLLLLSLIQVSIAYTYLFFTCSQLASFCPRMLFFFFCETDTFSSQKFF